MSLQALLKDAITEKIMHFNIMLWFNLDFQSLYCFIFVFKVSNNERIKNWLLAYHGDNLLIVYNCQEGLKNVKNCYVTDSASAHMSTS